MGDTTMSKEIKVHPHNIQILFRGIIWMNIHIRNSTLVGDINDYFGRPKDDEMRRINSGCVHQETFSVMWDTNCTRDFMI